MPHIQRARKHLLLNILLLSCAMLLLAVYASIISANELAATDTTGSGTETDAEQAAAQAAARQQLLLQQQAAEQAAQLAAQQPAAQKQLEAAIDPPAQDIDITPIFDFTSPANGKTIRDTLDIKGTVEIAKSVEFYLIKESSNTKFLIGPATKQSANTWSRDFNLKDTPNGTYYLIAQINNEYGLYESGKIKITLGNTESGSTPATNTTPAKNSKQEKTTVAPSTKEAPSTTQTTQTTNSTEPMIPDQIQNNAQKIYNYNGQTSNEWQKKYFENENCQKEDYCGGDADPDTDEISNNDEFRYGINPLNPDTDGDGYLDSAEIKNGFDPLKPSSSDKSDKIVFESPKEKGEIKKNIYQVNKVELIRTDDVNKLKLSGIGLPNSFVTIYIYSSLPIILTVKADINGDWSYTMDKQLEDGEHEVYVAVTDNTGKITAKSEPLPFIKTAEAVTVIEKANASERTKASLAPTQARTNSDMLLVFAIILLSLGLVFSIVNLTIIYRAEK